MLFNSHTLMLYVNPTIYLPVTRYYAHIFFTFLYKLLYLHIPIVKCSDLNKEGTPELVDTRGSCRRFSIFEK